jgi:hypothetical protein
MDTLKTYPIVIPLSIHEDTCTKAQLIMEAKCQDYASAEDPFRNFRQIEALGLGSVEVGIIVRMGDKLARLAGFAKNGELAVVDETAEDTCLDLINYTIILLAAVRSRAAQKNCAEASEGW